MRFFFLFTNSKTSNYIVLISAVAMALQTHFIQKLCFHNFRLPVFWQHIQLDTCKDSILYRRGTYSWRWLCSVWIKRLNWRRWLGDPGSQIWNYAPLNNRSCKSSNTATIPQSNISIHIQNAARHKRMILW